MGTPKDELSEREKGILQLVARGASNKEIAAELDISANTVKVHLRNIFAKLEVRSRTEATMVAIEMGLVQTTGAAPAAAVDTEATEATDEPAPVRSLPAPVRTWQKLLLLAAIAIAIVAAVWPAMPPGASTAAVSPDPMRDTSSFGEAISEQEDVGRWKEMAQMPLGRARFASAMVGNLLIAVGGDSSSGVTGKVGVYDTDANTWRLGADKPVPVSNAGAAAVGGLVYVVGGFLSDGRVTDVVEIYDPATDTWRPGPSLPSPLCSYAIVADGARILLFGGWDGERYTGDVHQLDVESGRWSVVGEMPYARGHTAAALLGGKAYVIGGYDGERVLRRVDVYDPVRGGPGAWSAAPPLSEARAGLAAVSLGETLYVIGGGWSQPVAFSERLTLGERSWQRWETPVPGHWRNLGAGADASSIYAVGGWNGALQSAVYRYQAVYRIMIPVG